MEIIDRCEKLYKFIDCCFDWKKDVPISNKEQSPKNHVDALFYKMKADYLRMIYECLSGDNGLLDVFD
jgi:hypothetical protein